MGEIFTSKTPESDGMDKPEQNELDRGTRREDARLSALVENLTMGLFWVNKSGRITQFNMALENLLNIAEADYLDRNYQELFAQIVSMAHEPDVVQLWLNSAVMGVLERPQIEFTIQQDGDRHLQLSFFPIWDAAGQSLGWAGLLQDITDQREQTAWKLELLSILSHDIRTPLATLKGHATALLANYRSWSDSMVIEFLETINRGVDDLVHQVDRNLALTRVESGRLGLRPEAANVRDIIQQSLERCAGILQDTPVQIDLPDPIPQVRVDPARTEEVLMNLLENAARFTRQGQPITVRAQVDPSMVIISVQDLGPGVPADKQKKIFDKYERSLYEGGGTGLGLFISRKIVEAQGGRIWVECPPKGYPQGSEFKFSIPAMPEQIGKKARETRLEETTAQVPVKPENGKRVLVVEDEGDIQALLRTILTKDGYQVEMATDGRTAIDLLQVIPVDLVLLDWMLPDLDGLTVCRNIRRWSNVPLIVVTSKTSQDDLVSALYAGADDYITKPFRTEEVLARMHAVLRRGEKCQQPEEKEQFQVDGLVINYESREVILQGERVELTPTEYDLLAYMVRHRRQVLTYEQLIDQLWDWNGDGTRHSLFVHISRLRRKIEQNPKEPRFIQTRWGIGYAFVPD